MRTLAIAFIVSFFGFSSAQAGCTNKQTQLAMNNCAYKVYKNSDRRMNSIYRRAISAQQKDEKTALRKAQRSWITYRDRACKSYSNISRGGSIRPLLFHTCLSNLTNQRSKMLQVQTIGLGG